MPTKSDYPADPVEACRAVMAELWTALAAYNEYMVLIGGWVPYFLLERHSRTDPGHVGSLDVDLALDASRIPEVAYQTILDILQKRGYRQRRDRLGRPIPFSYLRTVETVEDMTVEVQVDFLAPEYGGTGKSRRHQVVQDLLARKVRGADLVFDHFEVETLEACLPNRAVVDANPESRKRGCLSGDERYYSGTAASGEGRLRPVSAEQALQGWSNQPG